MKRKSLILLTVLALALVVTGVRAEEIETQTDDVSPTGMKQFREEAKELREKNKEVRETLREENKDERESFREQRKTDLEKMKEENKTSRETVKEETKTLLEGKTPEEKLTLMPTVNAMRKAQADKNRANVKEFATTQNAEKKSLVQSIQTKMDEFRLSVRSSWTNLWSSFFGKK
ncbi:MAG: hypothetical protein WA061_05325 [Microgenomates group bacterium]